MREYPGTSLEIPMDDQSVAFEDRTASARTREHHSSTSPTTDTSVRSSERMLKPPARLRDCPVTTTDRERLANGL
jgi:hypothetical protein